MKLFIVLLLLIFSACAGVTGTGNPCAGTDCLDAEYRNETYGVTFEVPNGWELSDSSQQSSGGNDSHPGAASVSPESHLADVVDPVSGTTIEIYVRVLGSTPTSLFHYLTQSYPGQSFVAYNTSSLNGYVYDDPLSGDNGGDAKTYYFLKETQLFKVAVEQFGSDAGVTELLSSLRLQ